MPPTLLVLCTDGGRRVLARAVDYDDDTAVIDMGDDRLMEAPWSDVTVISPTL